MMTTSRINYTVLVLTILSCMTKSRSQVTVFKEIINEDVFVHCHVCSLDHDITLYPPSYNPDAEDNRYFAVCHKPIHVHVGVHQCENPLHTINLDTKTVTFRLGHIGSFDNGNWTCTHGNLPGYITLEAPEKNPAGHNDMTWIAPTIFALFFGTSTFVLMLRRCLGDINKRKKNTDPERQPILESADNNSNEIFGEVCHTCEQLSTCAICSNCSNEYCEICCDAHTKYYPEHSVCQVEHYFTSKTQVKCKSCTNETASVVCTTCKMTLCSKCKEDHEKLPKNHKMKKLYPESTRPRRTDESEYVIRETKFSYKISIKKEENGDSGRICGIGFLSDCRIVTVDNSNNKMLVYDEGGFQFAEKLSDEPRGLAQMTGERIALTFGYKMEIRIYLIEKNHAVEEQKITMKTLGLDNLKPFSISYNKNHLAIEVGEGDDGRIVIINIDGENITVKYTISNKNNFAFFTGNTIRIALDMEHRKIFISGMSKKIVSCIDFDGNIVWNQVIPSPRSLLFISKVSSSGKNVICASRRCSVIFRLDENTGKDDCLLSKGIIRYPRYIAYHEGKSLLCVQVATDLKADPFGEELLVFKYNLNTTVSDKDETEN